MSIFDYGKEKQVREELESLFKDKVKISKSELKDFLRKKYNVEFEKDEDESLSIEDIEKVDFVETEEPKREEPEEETINKNRNVSSQVMDRLLDEYQNPTAPQKADVGSTQMLVAGGGGENNAMQNVGGGVEIYKDKSGSDLRIRTLSATGSASVSQSGDLIVINATDVSGTDSWIGVSADYYTKTDTDGLIAVKADLSAVSGDNDSWTGVSADYYTSAQVETRLITKEDSKSITSQIIAYSATSADGYILCSASNVTLPSATGLNKKVFHIKNRSETTMSTVDVIDGGTIDKESSQVILALDNLQVVSDGTEYWIL